MTVSESSNSTLYSLYCGEAAIERYLWMSWMAFVFITSLIGDGTILVASIKYRAFKLHECIVVFVQHISAGDLLISIFSVFPAVITLCRQKWIFGTIGCYIKFYITGVSWVASSLFICLMSLYKLILLKYPQKARLCNRGQAYKVCAVVWLLSLPSAHGIYLYFKNTGHLDFETCNEVYTCTPTNRKTSWYQYLVLLIVVLVIFIVIVAFLLTKHLLKARRLAKLTGRKPRWQGIATVLVTALLHCVSFVPVIVREMGESYISRTHGTRFYSRFARATYTLFNFNLVANIFIYSFTVPSFRNFLISRAQLIWSTLSLFQRQLSGKTKILNDRSKFIEYMIVQNCHGSLEDDAFHPFCAPLYVYGQQATDAAIVVREKIPARYVVKAKFHQ